MRIGDRRLDPGESLVLPLSASDPDGDALSFGVEGLPDLASFVDAGDGTAMLGWTPLETDLGNHVLTVSVVDGGIPFASDQERVSITVGAVNRAPSLDPIGVIEEVNVAEPTFLARAQRPDPASARTLVRYAPDLKKAMVSHRPSPQTSPLRGEGAR